MMDFFFSALMVFVFVLFTIVFIYFLDEGRRLHKEEFIESTINRVSNIVSDKMYDSWKKYKTGPWYLVVYTYETDYPIWISHNNIRSVHPDPANNKIIVKQFNGEDIVIENVERYELCPSEDMCNYEM